MSYLGVELHAQVRLRDHVSDMLLSLRSVWGAGFCII